MYVYEYIFRYEEHTELLITVIENIVLSHLNSHDLTRQQIIAHWKIVELKRTAKENCHILYI